MTTWGKAKRLAALVALAALSGCTIQSATPPALSGPSELGLSLLLRAIPDVITQDGLSEALIVIEARDESGQPVRNLALRLEISLNGNLFDFGALSTRSVVTGSAGRAEVTYTAPPPPIESVDVFTIVTILATPISSDYAHAVARSVQIRLMPPGILIPQNLPPVAAFTFSHPAEEGTPIIFDASTSTDTDGSIVSYSWTFGDGTTGTGVTVTKTYNRAGIFTVTLTVTDDRGATDTDTQSVTVNEADAPTASIAFSPLNPAVRQRVFFTGEGSRAATGRQIVSYRWQFGDGGSASGVRVNHRYEEARTYTVVLTVTDDLGKQGTATTTVSVTEAEGGLFASFTFSPSDPEVGEQVFFNASESTSPNGIRTYAWDFGDGSTFVSPDETASHVYTAAATYVVRLTITDNTGRTATTSLQVEVE